MKKSKINAVTIWLALCALSVLIITIIGGYTRLSGSGLSIVEWKPITGTIPPLNTQEWLAEFAKYKMSPEYNLKNHGMSLEEFKQIFLVEYIHRLIGRIAGIICFLPFIYFLIKKQLSHIQIKLLSCICILGLLQAGIGWYMVSSGLKSDPYVSHYRLALHLGVAMIIYSILVWLTTPQLKQFQTIKKLNAHLCCLTALTFLQIIIGAFVSGLKAGLIYNSFPLMDSKILPDELWNLPNNPFDSPVFVQFVHRVVAIIIFLYTIHIFIQSRFLKKTHYIFFAILFAVTLQFILGIITLLMVSPWPLALAHQLLAVILLTILITTVKQLHYK